MDTLARTIAIRVAARHHAPQHRRAVDPGDRAVRRACRARLRHAARARASRRRRRRHALSAGAAPTTRESARRAAARDRAAARRCARSARSSTPAALAPAHRPHAHGQGRHARPAGGVRSTTATRRHAAARARVVHTYHGHVLEGYFSPAQNADVHRHRTAAGARRPIASSPSRRRFAASCWTTTASAARDQYRVVPLGFDLDALAADRRRARGARARGAADSAGGARRHDGRPADGDQAARALSRRGRRVVARAIPRAVFLHRRRRRAARRARGAARARSASRIACGFSAGAAISTTIYGATDVFLLTSRNEGTPVALIESHGVGRARRQHRRRRRARRHRQRRRSGCRRRSAMREALAEHVADAARAIPSGAARWASAGRAHVVARYGIDRLVDDIDRALSRDARVTRYESARMTVRRLLVLVCLVAVAARRSSSSGTSGPTGRRVDRSGRLPAARPGARRDRQVHAFSRRAAVRSRSDPHARLPGVRRRRLHACSARARSPSPSRRRCSSSRICLVVYAIGRGVAPDRMALSPPRSRRRCSRRSRISARW